MPGPEICDGMDNDCDPSTEDGAQDPMVGEACDGDDSDLCQEGTASCVDGALFCDDMTGDSAELCDGLDNDCNPMTVDGADEAMVGAPCDGGDLDLCLEGSTVCRGGALECNDGSDNTPDVCDGMDNDCNPGTADGANDDRVGVACDGPDDDLCPEGMTICAEGGVSCDDTTGDAVEVCDGMDNDCDPSTPDGADETCPDVTGGSGICRGGACTFDCSADRGDCNARASDGCEVDHLTNDRYCGDCTTACESGFGCEAGVCVRQSALLRSFGSATPQAVATDSSGNVYLVGYFSGSANFGAGVLTSAGSFDIFLASYTADGAYRWARVLGGANAQYARDVAVDTAGDIYVVGNFSTSANLGGSTLTSRGSTDAFVASYSGATGAHRWSRRHGGTSSDSLNAVSVSGTGVVAVTGYFAGVAIYGGTSMTSAGGNDVVVAYYNSSSGTHRWSARYGGSSSDYGRGIASDGFGTACVVGDFAGTVNFGRTTHSSRGSADIFVACYSASGSASWSRSYGGTGIDRGQGVSFDRSRNVLVTGAFSGTATIGSRSYSSVGGYDIFSLALSSLGSVRWTRTYGSSGSDYGRSVAADSRGQVYMAGYAYGAVNFGGGALRHYGSADIVTAGLSTSGSHRWSNGWGGTSSDFAYDIAASSSGLYVVGRYRAPADFGAGTVATVSGLQGFLARVDLD